MTEYKLISASYEFFAGVIEEMVASGYTLEGNMTTVLDRNGRIVHSQLIKIVTED